MMIPNHLDMSKILVGTHVHRIFEAVEAQGGVLRFVGGAVRDTLAGRGNAFKIDLATDLSPDELVEACQDYGLKTVPLGLKLDEVGVVIDNDIIEIASLRKDIITEEGKVISEFTDDWSSDASRRDLTINAVYADLDGNVFDYYNGITDLKNGVVRFVGEAEDRVTEDPLRILRFFRFYSIFGCKPMNKEALKACVKHKEGLRSIAIERVRDELFKLLVTPQAAKTLQVIFKYEIMSYFLPVSKHLDALERLAQIVEDMEYQGNFLRRLFVLYQPNAAEAENIANTLRLGKKQKEMFINWAKIELTPENMSSPQARMRFIYRYGKEFCRDKILLTTAIYNVQNQSVGEVLREVENAIMPIFPLKGRDLASQNIATGATIGRLLDILEQQWMDSNFTLTRGELLDMAKKLA